jgi:hypothetical protein
MPRWLPIIFVGLFASTSAGSQSPASLPARPPDAAQNESVHAIARPRNPIPPESETAGITKFSFIVYGDTRGRRDGIDLQYEHSLIVDSMIATIKRLEGSNAPVKFVLQTGDAVVNGRDPAQWNASFVGLIDRITRDAGVSYFLAPGNHDVSGAPTAEAPLRQSGLKNYLSALDQLIPPDGAPRRLQGYPTYAFGYGNTFVIAFDSNIAGDDKQYEWIKTQLEGLDRTRFGNVITLCHHPAFSSGPHGGARIEPPAAAIRERYLPLFRKHHVAIIFSGHEHFFEHWVERYQDSTGSRHRMDHILTGGGGAPLYSFQGRPDVRSYLTANASAKVELEQLATPGVEPGDNAYHYVVVHVDGTRFTLEITGIDWGAGFRPYRSRRAELQDNE